MSRKTKKLIWSVPLVAVLAVAGALAVFMAVAPGGLFASEVTDDPMNLKVEPAAGSAGRTALVLTWDAPVGGETPTGYRIDVSTDNKRFTYLAMTDASTRTHTHSGVPGSTGGTERFYRVFATNEHGAGRVSRWESETTRKVTTPDQVKPFAWTSTDPTKVVLTWTEPDNGGAAILGYCIRAWPTGTMAEPAEIAELSPTNCTNAFATEGPGVSSDATDGGVKASNYRGAVDAHDRTGGVIRIEPAETYTHSGLRAKQEWSYEIYAVNKHGYSEVVSATRKATTAAAKNPSPPGSLLAVQASDANARVINLYWTKPDAMGQAITGYEIEVSDRSSQWPSAAVTAAVASQKVAAGTSAATGQLAPNPGDTSARPPNVALITVTAAELADDSVATDEPYQLQHTYTGVGGEFADTLHYRVRTVTGTGTSEKKSTSYAYDSIDIEADASGGHDAPIDPPLLGADGPTEDDNDDGTIQASEVDQDTNGSDAADPDNKPGELRLIASHTTTGANGYRVDISTDNGATWTTHEEASRPINQYDVRGASVSPGKRYRFRLFSKRGNYGLASVVVQDYAGHSKAPGEVQGLTATKDGAGNINLSWMAPESTGGATIDAYCIAANMDNAGANYRGDGDGTVGGDAADGIVDVIDDADTPALETNCTRFGSPAKSPISLKNKSEAVFQVAGSTISVSFKDVLAEDRWYFEVYGLNGATGPTVETGSPPAEATLVIGLAELSERNDAATDPAIVPGAPGYLTAEDARDTNVQGVGQQGVLVIWTAPANPAGAPVIGYKVEVSKDDSATFETLTDNLNTGETHFVDEEELPMDESRVYRVTSINSVGVGTETITVTLPLAEHTAHTAPPAVDELTAPSITAATPGTGTITVEWTPGDNADGHLAMLFTDDFVGDPVVATKSATETMHTFPNVVNGAYVVVVVSYNSSFDFQFVFTSVSVPAN